MGMPKTVDPNQCAELFDDFWKLDTVQWTSVDDGGTGTNTCNAVRGGEISLVTAASDNDYHLLKGAAASFVFAASKPLWFEARINLTEANTDDANFFLGLSSVVDGTIVQDNGAGPPSTFTGAGFYKVDGGTSIAFITSVGTAQVINAEICPFTSGRTYRVGFHFDPGDGTNGRIYPWVYDETAGALYATGKSSQDLAHPITYTATAMSAIFGVKAGAGNAETLKADYVRYIVTR